MTDLDIYVPPEPVAVVLSTQDLEMIRRQVDIPKGKQAPTDAELTDFGRTCMARRLDPFDRHIYLANFGGGWRAYIGVHGRLVIAFRTGLVAGMDGPYFCGPREGIERAQPPDWQELWDGKGHPHAARFVVHRKGMDRASPVGVARWAEYGKDYGTWVTNPPLMLGYKAITRALNLVFPDVMPADSDREVDVDESVGYVREEPAAALTSEQGRKLPTAPEPIHRSNKATPIQIATLSQLWRDCEVSTAADIGLRLIEVRAALGRDVDDDYELTRTDMDKVIAHVEARKASGWKGY
jgi:hypothetical protein